jgi:hypothetical protein
MRVAITFAVLIALGSQAHAGGEVGVIVTGEGTMQSQLAAQIESWLSQHGHTLVQTPLPSDAIPLLDDCFALSDPKSCARRIIENRAKAPSMVFAHLKTTGDSTENRDITLTAFWFDRNRAALTESTVCERCTDQLLRSTADAVMKKLASSLVGHIKFTSTPPGATLTIDGEEIAVTPIDWDLPPGKHTIQMTSRGYEPMSKEIVVVADKRDALDMKLVPVKDDPARPRSRILPITTIAVGGLLMIGGGVMIAIDQDEGPKEPATIYNTGPTGVATLALGGVVAGVGTYLLLRSPGTTSAPIAAISSDAAYIGWLGRF